MLQLKYSKASDKSQTVTVIGDPAGIRNLYWQLTENHACIDGTGIGEVRVLNLSGDDVTATVMAQPWSSATQMSNLDD